MPFTQQPIPTFSEAQMLAQLPTSGNFYFFYNSDKDGDLYMVDSTGTFTFVADADADGDCCTCALTMAWLCALNKALLYGQMTALQYSQAISLGINITQTTTSPGNCTIKVSAPFIKVTSVVVTSSSSSMPHTGTMQMAAAVLPAGSYPGVFWATSDAAKATIDQSGLLTGVAAGAVVVSAYSTVDSSIVGTKDITVT